MKIFKELQLFSKDYIENMSNKPEVTLLNFHLHL